MDTKSDKELAIEFAKTYVASCNQNSNSNHLQVRDIPELLQTVYETIKQLK